MTSYTVTTIDAREYVIACDRIKVCDGLLMMYVCNAAEACLILEACFALATLVGAVRCAEQSDLLLES